MLHEKWLKGYKGERKSLPQSERQGHELAQKVLYPIQAQIAVFFGQPGGTLQDLQNGVMKLSKGEAVICESCARDIWKEQHKADCSIAIAYKEVTTNEPTPPAPTPRAGR